MPFEDEIQELRRRRRQEREQEDQDRKREHYIKGYEDLSRAVKRAADWYFEEDGRPLEKPPFDPEQPNLVRQERVEKAVNETRAELERLLASKKRVLLELKRLNIQRRDPEFGDNMLLTEE